MIRVLSQRSDSRVSTVRSGRPLIPEKANKSNGEKAGKDFNQNGHFGKTESEQLSLSLWC
jgi:hypothetical protein